MPGVREHLLFEISRRLIRPPDTRTQDWSEYRAWRNEELAAAWRRFSDADVRGKDLLDFGCGFGELGFFLASRGPKSITGVELAPHAVERAKELFAGTPYAGLARFLVGTADHVPAADASFDTILAFDCLEHVMEPERILAEWKRVLRPGGKVLISWSPFRGPYGPHMEAVIPVPWARVIFGEQAMIKTAARIYDLDAFVPRMWNLDEHGRKKPNLWHTYRSLRDWNFINELTEERFLELCERTGLEVARLEPHGFQGSPLKRMIGAALVKLPAIREYMTSFYVVELVKPRA